jgi:hypothetical protein
MRDEMRYTWEMGMVMIAGQRRLGYGFVWVP